MNKTMLATGALLGLLGLVLGALGTHGLKALIAADALQTFETGVKYQIYHALLLLFVGSTHTIAAKHKKTIYFLVVPGVILFSGSIYGLATNAILMFDVKKIAFITPIGGMLLIMAWGMLFWSFTISKTQIK